MGIQSQFFLADGSTRTFTSTKPIINKNHVRVFLQETTEAEWEVKPQASYENVNNSIVFDEAYSGYKIEVRVADTEDELEDSPTNIGIVADISEEVTIVSGVSEEVRVVAEDLLKGKGTNQPTDSAILNALDNAIEATDQVALATIEADRSGSRATDAQIFFLLAESEKTTAGTFSDISIFYSQKSEEWAEKPTEVEVGKDSSKTWALRSEASALRAEQYDPLTNRTVTPIVSMTTTLNSEEVTTATITNYNSNFSYNISATLGSITQNGATFDYTAPTVSGSANITDSVLTYATESGKLQSFTDVQNITVSPVSVPTDDTTVTSFTNTTVLNINDGYENV